MATGHQTPLAHRADPCGPAGAFTGRRVAAVGDLANLSGRARADSYDVPVALSGQIKKIDSE